MKTSFVFSGLLFVLFSGLLSWFFLYKQEKQAETLKESHEIALKEKELFLKECQASIEQLAAQNEELRKNLSEKMQPDLIQNSGSNCEECQNEMRKLYARNEQLTLEKKGLQELNAGLKRRNAMDHVIMNRMIKQRKEQEEQIALLLKIADSLAAR